MQDKYGDLRRSADDIVVFLGRYNIDSKIERSSVQAFVDEIQIHPDWNISSDSFDADIAILVLADLVKFSDIIQPVCLSKDKQIKSLNDGFVVKH